MNRQEFTELIKNISELPNDLTIRRAFLEREFVERYKYSIDDGYSITSAYFEEFEHKQDDTLQRILISNKLRSDFAILFNYKGYEPKHNLLRMSETDFDQSKELFMPLYSLGVTKSNVHEIFERNFNRWRVSNSHEVTSDGTPLNQFDKLMLSFPTKEPQTGTVEVSDTTKGGYQLTEQMFIDEQLRKYEPMYTRTIGSVKNREQNIKLRIWIDYLKKRQGSENPKAIVTTIDGNKWNTGEIYKQFNGVLFRCSKDVFNDWFVDGTGNIKKPEMDRDNLRQLYKLIQQIVINPDKAKMNYFNTVFGEKYKTNKVSKIEFDVQYKTKLNLCKK